MVVTVPDSERTLVRLREITGKNVKAILDLEVTEQQKAAYPRSNGYSIAEGHHPPDDDPVWMRAICVGETPVGFLMTSEDPQKGVYFLWRLMIGANHQGKGYGSRTVELLIERIQASGNAKELLTSHLAEDGEAGRFYEKLGFEYTGEILGNCDHVMRIDFSRDRQRD